MSGFPLLTILIAIPLIAGLVCLFVNANTARWVALIATLIDLALGVYMWTAYDPSGAQWQFVENISLGGGISWALGIDGIAMVLLMLSLFLMPICIGASWRSIQTRVPEYMAVFMLMETLMLGVFAAQDLFLFYIFFEAGLIPMYLIIGIWGGVERIKASYKFFLYTLLGSVLMLIAMLYMASQAHTTFIPTLMAYDFPFDAQKWLWLAFFASFAVKMPMWPVHTWLPDAHVQAPTAGSVILAGVLLKMGGYGFIRFSLPMFPEASAYFLPLVFVLSGIAVVYTSLVALVQRDMKKLIAYSSVAHMAFVTFTWGAIAATTGIILGAAYMLLLYWRIAFGTARTAEAAAMPDLSTREWWLLAPIAAVVLWMGVYPESFIRPIRSDVGRILERIDRAAPASDSALTAGKPAAAAAQAHEAAQ